MPTPTITWGETEEALIREGRSCSLDSYDFTKAYSLDRQRLMSFADGSMVEAGENGFLHGGPGTGKTHLCYAIAAEVAAKGKTVRVLNGDNCELLRLELPWSRIGQMTAAEMELFPMMRPDLVNCDLLIVNELMCPGLNHQDRGHLGNLLATRYKNGRSTFISSRRKPTDIVRLNLMYDDYAGITTGRMFVELNIGYVLEERDGYPEFNALIDDETPHTEAHDAFMRLRMLKPSWLNKRLRERLAVKPGKEWHLMWMLQDSYRLVQRQLAEAQAQTS